MYAPTLDISLIQTLYSQTSYRKPAYKGYFVLLHLYFSCSHLKQTALYTVVSHTLNWIHCYVQGPIGRVFLGVVTSNSPLKLMIFIKGLVHINFVVSDDLLLHL